MPGGETEIQMHRTSRTLDGRTVRMSRALDQRGADERLATLTREAAQLEQDALHWSDRGNTAFAIGCAAEAAAMRAEARRLADAKFTQRARPRTVTFEREPARLAKAPAVLRHHAEKLMTRNGWTRWVDAFQRIHGRALDDMTALGRRKGDRQPTKLGGSFRNTGTRIH